MPKFVYTAKSGPGKVLEGDVDAESRNDAIHKLADLGYFPIRVEVADSLRGVSKDRYLKEITHREVIYFTRDLATLVESGVNILKGLSILSSQTFNSYLKFVLEDVIAQIRDGKTLSDSLSSYPQLFSSLYISMLRAGEVGGHLDKTMRRLADFLEKQEDFFSSIRSALIYPAFIFVLSLATILVLLGFVIPRISAIFTDMGQILPLPTRILLSASGFFCRTGWLFVTGAVLAILIFKRFSLQPGGRIAMDRLKLKLPVLKNIVLKAEISRLMRTLSLLLSGGVPVVSALDTAQMVVGNRVLSAEIKNFKEKISRGMSFSRCLKESSLFAPLVVNIVIVGEEGGTLERSLMRIAEDYEKDVDRLLKAFVILLEPMIILLMGLIVGFIVISMLLPIFQINIMAR